MDGHQELVAFAGLGLAAVNLWTGKQRAALGDVVWGSGDPQPAHKALLQLGGELLLLLVLIMAAGQSPSLGVGMIAVVAALWVLWGINHYAPKAKA